MSDVDDTFEGESPVGAARPEVKQGGWGADQTKPPPKRTHDHLTKDDEEDERFNMAAPDLDDSDDEDASEAIPDLDHMQREELANKIAEAPAATVQMSTMAELDQDLSAQAYFSQADDGVDLRLLTDALVAFDQVHLEKDNQWDFDHIFTEVKSELEVDREAKEKAEAETEGSAATDLPL